MPVTPFDVNSLPAARRLVYRKIGRKYGSDDTYAQANLTLKGWKAHAPSLKGRGFVAADAAKLESP